MAGWLLRQAYRVGGFNTVKSGAPPRLGDLYNWLMEMGWPAFIEHESGLISEIEGGIHLDMRRPHDAVLVEAT